MSSGRDNDCNNNFLKDNSNISENGSANGEVGGNNSDNSALVSLGNTSFGFNFDSEEGGMNGGSPHNSSNSEEGDSSDQGGYRKSRKAKGGPKTTGSMATTSTSKKHTALELQPPQIQQLKQQPQHKQRSHQMSVLGSALPKTGMTAGAAAAKIISDSSSNKTSSSNNTPSLSSTSRSDAASEAVANLKSIARAAENNEKQGVKRKAPSSATISNADNDSSNGYNSEDEGQSFTGRTPQLCGSASKSFVEENQPGYDNDYEDGMEDDPQDNVGASKGGRKLRKKKLDDLKREERNAREKERSFRISKQIDELRNLLSSGGVIVPKGTKSSVLTEAANYIRMLQQHQYRSEIDRHQLVQQIQMIGGGALGQEAANAVRRAAAQNGVWSLGNFGGMPPKSAMMYHPETEPVPSQDSTSAAQEGSAIPSKVEEGDYRHVFNSSAVGMAIASLGGAFIDCNKLFCELTSYTKQEVCSMTVFNLTARQDLQPAFDLISQMLSAPADPSTSNTSCVLRGSLKHRNDLGLSVALIKGEDEVAKCFCVTLIMSPASPYDTAPPIPATVDLLNAPHQEVLPMSKDGTGAGLDPSPAYTAG